MNKDIFELLKKYEKHLQRAMGNYLFGFFQEDYDVLYPIYQQLGGREHLRYSCVNCNIRLLQYIGKYYFNYKPEPEEYPEHVQEKEPKEDTNEVVVKPKRKRTTTKRTTTKKKTTKYGGFFNIFLKKKLCKKH